MDKTVRTSLLKQTNAYNATKTTIDSPSATAATLATASKNTGSQAGLLRRLSEACCVAAQNAANLHDVAHVYDNINTVFKAAEQIVGRKDSIENGTCATAIRLFEANKDDMQTSDLLDSMSKAPELNIADIVLTGEEALDYRRLILHTILRIIVEHGGPSFTKFKDAVADTLPITPHQVPVHKTEFYPLPAMEIDESSTVGNADVVDAISASLAYDTQSPEYLSTVKIYSGDQLSMARLRSVSDNRVGNDFFHHSHRNIVQAPGFFHGQMHAASACLETHWGLSEANARDPGSLSFHNTVADRKPIVLTSPPPYRTCRDLIYVSLYARLLHCLELVSELKVADYAATATFDDLQRHVQEIYDRFVDSSIVDRLRNGKLYLMNVWVFI